MISEAIIKQKVPVDKIFSFVIMVFIRSLFREILLFIIILRNKTTAGREAQEPRKTGRRAFMSTIREVAALAGVSIATVSRVMNNDNTYKITDETRDRVWKAIVELNYKAAASRRKTGSGESHPAVKKIGCVIKLRGGKYSDPYYLSLLSGMENYLLNHHAEVSFVRTWNELENSEVLLRIFSEPLDGLILMSHVGEAIFHYALSKVPHIVGIDTGYREIDNIEYDHIQAGELAVSHLFSLGYREIGFIGGPEGEVPMQECRRFHAYRNALLDRGLKIQNKWVLDCDWNDARCARLVKEIGADELPQVFFASSDLMAMAALRALSEMGVSVPERVGVMGLTNLEMSRYANPPLTTLDVPTEEMGAAAAKTLLQRIGGDGSLPRRILFPVSLVSRSSV